MAFIHKFKQGENYFVLDVNTGAVHIVDELVYDILDDDKLKEKVDVINELKEKYSVIKKSMLYFFCYILGKIKNNTSIKRKEE